MSNMVQEPFVGPGVSPRKANPLRWLPKRWHVHLLLIVSCLIIGFPLYYAMLVGTQDNPAVYRYQFTPGDSLSDNWDVVMNKRNLGSFMLNSTVVAISVTVGKTVLSLLAGLAFVYFRFPGKWIVFGFVLITLMMPTEILIIALFRFVSDIGKSVIDQPLLFGLKIDRTTFERMSLIMPFLASATGSFLFRQHFSNIPAEMAEAAQLDGATPWQFLWRVLVPISWNTIGALAVIQFVYVWNMFLWPQVAIQKLENQVVQVGLRQLVGSDQASSFGPLMLGAVIASIPPILVFILLQKQFMSGFQLSRDK